MVKRKIVWSHQARIKLYDILDFYAKRNKSKRYSRKLYKKFQQELNLLLKQPDIGILTDTTSVRGLIVGDYIIFYELNNEKITVHTIWDCRQNPQDLVIK